MPSTPSTIPRCKACTACSHACTARSHACTARSTHAQHARHAQRARTVRRPSSVPALKMRMAISPRLAQRIFWKGTSPVWATWGQVKLDLRSKRVWVEGELIRNGRRGHVGESVDKNQSKWGGD